MHHSFLPTPPGFESTAPPSPAWPPIPSNPLSSLTICELCVSRDKECSSYDHTHTTRLQYTSSSHPTLLPTHSTRQHPSLPPQSSLPSSCSLRSMTTIHHSITSHPPSSTSILQYSSSLHSTPHSNLLPSRVPSPTR